MALKTTTRLLVLLVFCLQTAAYAQSAAAYNVGDIVSTVPVKPEKQNVITFPAGQLQQSWQQGWTAVEDLSGRNTTPLFFELKTDKGSVTSDSYNKHYCKTFIRFGFKDDANGYQLPGSFYIQEFHSNIDLFGEQGLSHKNPCLMFADGTFYIFVPNYTGSDLQEATLFTYNASTGLTRQVLWAGHMKESGALPYFTADGTHKFALVHSSYINDNMLRTTVENGKFVTRVAQLKVYQPVLENNYREQIQPYYLPLQPEPFKKVTVGKGTYLPICDLSVFLNTPKDRALYTRLAALPVKPMTEVQLKDQHKYKGLYFRTDSLNATRVFYDEVPYSRIEIQDMPATKNQDPFPSCESYAYGALYAQWINSDWQLKAMRKIEPDALRYETDISYFGMQQYLRGNKVGVDPDNLWRYPKSLQKEIKELQGGQPPEFDFEVGENAKFYMPFEIILQNENRLDDIPANVGSYYYKKYGTTVPQVDGKYTEAGDLFRNHLERLYALHPNDNRPNSAYQGDIAELSLMTGITTSNIDLAKAFAQPTFRAFMYQLFFGKSKDFVAVAYRNNLSTQQFSDLNAMKSAVVSVLQQGSPVKASILTMPNATKGSHAIVICGYKKLVDTATGKKTDAFKIHNSWGTAWDEQTNGGWFLADHILSYLSHKEFDYITADVQTKPLKRDWLENTDDYQRIYKGAYTQEILNMKMKFIGAAKSNNQVDATPLLNIMKNTKLTFREYTDAMKVFFGNLGYAYKSENAKDEEIEFEDLSVWFGSGTYNRYIVCPSKVLLNALKSKLDFSRINGEFTESAFSDGGNYLKVRQDND